jgi:hypothetical protein
MGEEDFENLNTALGGTIIPGLPVALFGIPLLL